MAVRPTRAELEVLIRNIEANGGDASELRAAAGERPATADDSEISDDDLVRMVRDEATVETGSGLLCSLCGDQVDDLINGACEPCFRRWVLSCKGSVLAAHRRQLAERPARP